MAWAVVANPKTVTLSPIITKVCHSVYVQLNKTPAPVVTDDMNIAKIRKPIAVWISALLMLGASLSVFADEIKQDAEGWILNLPAGWKLVQSDMSSGLTTFSSAQTEMVAQVFVSPPARFAGSNNLEEPAIDAIVSSLGGREEPDSRTVYLWHGRKTALADLSWSMAASGTKVRGYVLSCASAMKVYSLIVFCKVGDWTSLHPFLVSIADSFGLADADEYRAGAISTLLDSQPGLELQTSQDIVEREATVLAAYQKAPQELQTQAWRRFYQMIYRDNYEKIAPFAAKLQAELVSSRTALPKHPAVLASKLQNWKYERPGGLSDLIAPLPAVQQGIGDCDARGLVFMIVLKHWGMDSILMVSPKHKHSLVGLNIDGSGARFPFKSVAYLVTELTAKVEIGQIEQSMSDPKDWIGMDLAFKP